MVNKILVSFIDSRCYTFELSLSKRKLFKTFFDFGELKRIAQKIKDESKYLGKFVYCFFGAIALFAYVCIYLGLVGLTLMIIIK